MGIFPSSPTKEGTKEEEDDKTKALKARIAELEKTQITPEMQLLKQRNEELQKQLSEPTDDFKTKLQNHRRYKYEFQPLLRSLQGELRAMVSTKKSILSEIRQVNLENAPSGQINDLDNEIDTVVNTTTDDLQALLQAAKIGLTEKKRENQDSWMIGVTEDQLKELQNLHNRVCKVHNLLIDFFEKAWSELHERMPKSSLYVAQSPVSSASASESPPVASEGVFGYVASWIGYGEQPRAPSAAGSTVTATTTTSREPDTDKAVRVKLYSQLRESCETQCPLRKPDTNDASVSAEKPACCPEEACKDFRQKTKSSTVDLNALWARDCQGTNESNKYLGKPGESSKTLFCALGDGSSAAWGGSKIQLAKRDPTKPDSYLIGFVLKALASVETQYIEKYKAYFPEGTKSFSDVLEWVNGEKTSGAAPDKQSVWDKTYQLLAKTTVQVGIKILGAGDLFKFVTDIMKDINNLKNTVDRGELVTWKDLDPIFEKLERYQSIPVPLTGDDRSSDLKKGAKTLGQLFEEYTNKSLKPLGLRLEI